MAYDTYTEAGDHDLDLWLRFAQPIVRYATRIAQDRPATWLDFGAGSGELVLAAQQAGFDAVGIDPDARASALASVIHAISAESP